MRLIARSSFAYLSLLPALALLACSGSTDVVDAGGKPEDLGPIADLGPAPDDGPDLGQDAGPQPELRIGIGETEFMPFEDGDTLPLIERPPRGQGFDHVSVALRATLLAPGPGVFELTCERVSDGEEGCRFVRLNTILTPVDGLEDTVEALDLRMRVADPEEDVFGQDLIVRARLQDDAGLAVDGTRSPVRIAWGPGQGPDAGAEE